MTSLLEVEGLCVTFGSGAGAVRAVRDLDLSVESGEIVALVGESGCGKSLTALTLMRLTPPSARVQGSVKYRGDQILDDKGLKIKALRGKEIAMVFQEPMTSLNPSYTVGDQIAESIRLHLKLPRKQAAKQAIELLRRVRIAAPEQRAKAYPHQLSGGMRQRIMMAIALSCDPKLLILDEPTTALDVTTQAQVLEIVDELRKEANTGVILITHDLGVVADLADKVVIMYAGSTVEKAPVESIYSRPSHPYTRGLLAAIPRRTDGVRKRLDEIPGTVPIVRELPSGCIFADRCSCVEVDCRGAVPKLEMIEDEHYCACWHPQIEVETVSL